MAEINTAYTLYKAKANQTPLPNTAIQRCLSKKKKKPNTEQKRNQIQSKPNPRSRANQTHGGADTTRRRSSLRDLRRSSSSSSHRHSLARRRRSSLAHRRRSQIGLTVSTAPTLGLKVFLSLFLSDSLSQSLTLSHTKMKNMK